MNTLTSVTSVAAVGKAETDFDRATFVLSLDALEETVPLAKDKLKEKVDALNAALDTAVTKHGVVVVKNSTTTGINVSEKKEWEDNKQVSRGHWARFSMSFSTDTLDKVSELYDELTSLDDVAVNSPHFTLKNKDRLHKRALKDAFKKVQNRFEEECEVLELDAKSFEIDAWEVSYSDTHRSDNVRKSMTRSVRAYATGAQGPTGPTGAVGALGSTGPTEPLQIEVGKAQVTVNLEVAFKRKVAL